MAFILPLLFAKPMATGDGDGCKHVPYGVFGVVVAM
jgi:hypothetical protein